MSDSSQTTVSGAFSRAENFSNHTNRARGTGTGLVSVFDALAGAGIKVSAPSSRRIALGSEAMTIAQALASVEQPCGTLLLECQGVRDLALAQSCVSKLAKRMQADGREVNDDTRADAIAASAYALTVWRHTGTGPDGQPETLAGRVAWRAAVKEISRDTFGDSIQIHTVSDDWLWWNAAQGSESRAERAARFWVERAAKLRQKSLIRRLASMPAGRGKRAETIERIGNAAAMLLTGETLDNAAAMAGFKGNDKSRVKPGDRFKHACKRIGLAVGQFDARTSTRFHVPIVREEKTWGAGMGPHPEYVPQFLSPSVANFLWNLPGVDTEKMERRRNRRAWIASQLFTLPLNEDKPAQNKPQHPGRNWAAHVRSTHVKAPNGGHYTGTVSIRPDGTLRRTVLMPDGSTVQV